MHNALKWIVVAVFCSWIPADALAQDDEPPPSLALGDSVSLIPSAQYRARFLANGGRDFKPGNNFDAFSHRARLGVEARILEWYRLKLQLQDVRSWGEETDPLGDYQADGFDLHQAWAEAGCPLGLSLRVGRQELIYDNQRLIGIAGFSNQARSFDAVRAAYDTDEGALQVHAFYAKTGEEDAYSSTVDAKGNAVTVTGSEEDTDLAGLWVRYQAIRFVRPSLSVLYDWNGPLNQNRITLGAFVDGAPVEGLSYSGELYYQTGRSGSDAQRRDIAAFMGALGVGYRAPIWSSPSVRVWFEYLSGDDDASDDTIRSFDTLYATNHGLYGFMDFFLNIPVHTRGLGLVDVGGSVKLEPARWFRFLVGFHHFELAEKHSSGARTLGNEVDLLLDFPIGRYLALQGVFAVFAPKRGGALMRGDGTNRDTELYGYLQTDLRF